MRSSYIPIINYKEYELNLLGVNEFYNQTNSRLRFWYNHIKKNAHKKDGDIFEFGVYQGNSLISAALILKELNSKKKVFGFDTFKGFPSYSEFDDLKNFYNLKYFTKSFVKEYERFLKSKKIMTGLKKFTPKLIATSLNFNQTSFKSLKKKIDYLKLDNIEIIEGSFIKTVPDFFKSQKIKISSCNLDCDLYTGYKITLPYVYKNLSKGGYIHLDEYYSLKYPGAKIATDDFCKKLNLKVKKQISRKNEFQRWFLTK